MELVCEMKDWGSVAPTEVGLPEDAPTPFIKNHRLYPSFISLSVSVRVTLQTFMFGFQCLFIACFLKKNIYTAVTLRCGLLSDRDYEFAEGGREAACLSTSLPVGWVRIITTQASAISAPIAQFSVNILHRREKASVVTAPVNQIRAGLGWRWHHCVRPAQYQQQQQYWWELEEDDSGYFMSQQGGDGDCKTRLRLNIAQSPAFVNPDYQHGILNGIRPATPPNCKMLMLKWGTDQLKINK